MSTQKYVLGFLFNVNNLVVALIEKQKPAWMAGHWNGIGGKVEAGEDIHAAMVREFLEETGLEIPAWQHFARIEGEWGEVECFTARLSTFAAPDLHLQAGEIEKPEWVTLSLLATKEAYFKMLPNMGWLIPLAMDRTTGFVVAQDIPVNNSIVPMMAGGAA